MPNPLPARNVQILGIGSPILCDDAAGIEVVQRLRAEGLPEGVTATVGGTGGICLLDLIEKCEVLLVVDASLIGAEPGTIHELRPQDLERTPPLHLGATHGFDLADVLELLRVQGRNPPRQIHIIAIEARDVQTFSETCTPAVQDAIPRAADLIRSMLRELLGDAEAELSPFEEAQREAAMAEAPVASPEPESPGEPARGEVAEAEQNIEEGMGLAEPSPAPEAEPAPVTAATADPDAAQEPAAAAAAPEPEAEPEPPAEPDPDLAEQIPPSRLPWAALPGLLLDFGYLLALVLQALQALSGDADDGLGPLFPLLVLMGWTGVLGAFLLALRRHRRGTLRVPAWWGAVALLFPWATYLAVLTRPEFEEPDADAGRSFAVGATVVAGVGAVVFATSAHLPLLDPLPERLQAFGLGSLESARGQAADLGERAAEARLQVVGDGLDGGAPGALASGAQHAAGLSLVAALAVSVLETVGRVAWAFALPVVLPAGLLLLIPGLWRDSQVADKLAGFGSRLVVWALAFHLFMPVAGSAAQALGAYLPAGEALAAGTAPEAGGAGERGGALRAEGVALTLQTVAVPLLVLWLLGWGLRRLGRPLGRIHPERPAMDDADAAD